jgi:hypothetical protein
MKIPLPENSYEIQGCKWKKVSQQNSVFHQLDQNASLDPD